MTAVPEPPTDARPRVRRRTMAVTGLVGAAIGLTCAGFVGARLASQWAEVRDAVADASYGWIGAALVCAAAGMSWIALCWRRALALSGAVPAAATWWPGTTRARSASTCPAACGRYWAGASWPGVAACARSRAYPSVGLSLVALYLAALGVAAVLVPLDLAEQAESPAALALLVLLPLGLGVLHPRVLGWARDHVARLTGRGADVVIPPWGATVRLVVSYVPAWLCIWAATWCCARALMPDPPVLRTGIATTLSWTAGFVAVPVPAGAGVREAVFVAASGLPAGLGATIAVGSRLVFLVVDIAGAVLTGPRRHRGSSVDSGRVPPGLTAAPGLGRRRAPDDTAADDTTVTTDTDDLARRLAQGDRRALARSITLVESTRRRPTGRGRRAARRRAAARRAARCASASAARPGVGKSTFIDELGSHLTAAGHRVAVLAVDPSSRRSGGSIMGDKTRMERLARDQAAFIRPSPSGGTLGGVARRTREACCCARPPVSTSCSSRRSASASPRPWSPTWSTASSCWPPPGGGDELQGIKRGIMELADVIVVNKADGDLEPAARRAVADYRHAVHLLRAKHPGWAVPVVAASALRGAGVDDVWGQIERFEAHLRADGGLDRLRAGQAVEWMWAEVREQLFDHFAHDPAVAGRTAETEADVRAGRLSPTTGAHDLLTAHGLPERDEP